MDANAELRIAYLENELSGAVQSAQQLWLALEALRSKFCLSEEDVEQITSAYLQNKMIAEQQKPFDPEMN